MLRRLLDIAPVILAVLVVLGAAFGVVWLFFTKVLLPPDTLTIAAGREGGGYHGYALRYQAILAWDGILLQVVETAGSVENARLVAEGEADVAFLQGGVPLPAEAPVEALAALFLEPLLIFHSRDVPEAADPNAWNRLRVAAGEPESGTRAAVQTMVDRLALDLEPDRLLALGGADAVTALQAGQVEVAVFVAPMDAPYLEPLLTDPRFVIRPVRDGEALARRLPFVRLVDIPRSGLDYARALPPERIELTAMVASLVARDDLHPALVNRLIRAAQRIHATPSILTPTIEFPSSEGTGLSVDAQAAAALATTGDGLERALPYWMAAQITRTTVVLVPLLVLLLPILRATPGLLAWRLRWRVYRHYTNLVRIEEEASQGPLAPARRAALLAELDRVDRAIAKLNLPARYREYAYSLRLHLDLVRRHLVSPPKDGEVPGK